MKKLLLVLCSVMLVFGMVGSVSATTFVEEYTGYQHVAVNQSYNFEFDLWVENSSSGVVDDSLLTLTQDAVDAIDPWDSASLYIDFNLEDWGNVTAEIQLTAWSGENGTLHESFDLGTVSDNPGDDDWQDGRVYHYTHDLTTEQLSAFREGWGDIKITAASSPNYNRFAIMKVGMEVNTVPEPSTALLLGAGLLGLVGYNRKRFSKKG